MMIDRLRRAIEPIAKAVKRNLQILKAREEIK